MIALRLYTLDIIDFPQVIRVVRVTPAEWRFQEPADVGKYTVAGIRPDMDAVPPDCPVELISLMKAGVFFQKAKVLRWKLSFKQWMKYDEIV